MISPRLRQRIEADAERIARSLIEARDHTRELRTHRYLSDAQIRQWVNDLTGSFGTWLEDPDAMPLAPYYEQFGRRRFMEQMPLHEVLQRLLSIKEAIQGSAAGESCGSAVEVYEELEFWRAKAAFFEIVLFRVTKGYDEVLYGADEWSARGPKANGLRGV
jgi:hypothetical protein